MGNEELCKQMLCKIDIEKYMYWCRLFDSDRDVKTEKLVDSFREMQVWHTTPHHTTVEQNSHSRVKGIAGRSLQRVISILKTFIQ